MKKYIKSSTSANVSSTITNMSIEARTLLNDLSELRSGHITGDDLAASSLTPDELEEMASQLTYIKKSMNKLFWDLEHQGRFGR